MLTCVSVGVERCMSGHRAVCVRAEVCVPAFQLCAVCEQKLVGRVTGPAPIINFKPV